MCGRTPVLGLALLHLEITEPFAFDFLLPGLEQDESSTTAVGASSWLIHKSDSGRPALLQLLLGETAATPTVSPADGSALNPGVIPSFQ